VVEELAYCIRNKREARTGSASGLRVLSVLEAVNRSLSMHGQASAVAGSAPAHSGPAESGFPGVPARLERVQ
jgi:hypothetical protein